MDRGVNELVSRLGDGQLLPVDMQRHTSYLC